MTLRWIPLSWTGHTPVPFYDEDGKPVTYATRSAAQASVDADVAEWDDQVREGTRTPDEVPEPDDVMECTENADGSVTLLDGTHVPNAEIN